MDPTENKHRVSSVSFTPDKSDGGGDEIQISLAPYIQTYLAHSAQGVRCCGIGLPIPFERAAARSWWNPKFDSEILEEQYKQSVLPQLRSRFRYALAYILLFSLSWLIYVVIIGARNKTVSSTIVTTFCTIIIVMLSALYLTYTKYYKRYMVSTSLIVGSLLCVLSLLFLILIPPCNGGLSLVGHFSLCSEILLLIYTVIPLPLYVSVALCTIYSVLFEISNAYIYLPVKELTDTTSNIGDFHFGTTLAIRILMQTCIHIIALHILIMTLVRMRGTFMKVGQSLLVRRQLEMEKQLKEKMIHSVMPPKVADWLMTESEREREREDSIKKGSLPSNNTDIHSMFRPFNMHSMENVSILFADIVGFTRMSSNKTAEQLVDILNDLFERFDELCEQHGCEKISTLGDCYYCVSGCPEPRPDHARCCVEMGLAMIEAIKQFDIERHEGVNMRVGVHTGTVLCGIVGTKRFKFDVWSNDVNLANKLESTGMPGRVHLSEATLNFLGGEYLTEESTTIQGTKTYLIKDKKVNVINQFTTGLNLSPLLTRHRLASCNNQSKSRPHYLHMLTSASSCRIKANSLPSILDSEDDQQSDYEVDKKDENATKSPTSMTTRSKKRRGKAWKYLQRQHTAEEMTPLETKAHLNPEKIVGADSTTENHNQPNGLNGILPTERIDMDPDPSPSHSMIINDKPLSHASSMCSRKDSGIKSNSRRSSIQQQLFLMNGMCQNDLLGHRVSGYYTSTSTLNSAQDPPSSTLLTSLSPVITDTFGACFHKLRKQSDLQLIKCVQDNVSSQRSHFAKPPLSSLTLFFQNKEMEKEYRENAHKTSENIGENLPTLATARFNTYFDILVSAIVYSAVTTSLFLIYPTSIVFIFFVVIATVVQIIVIMLCFRHLIVPQTVYATLTLKIFKFLTRWYPWHACGAILVSLPALSIIINISSNTYRSTLNHFEYYYSYLIFVGLVHFCNFTQLNCWMKNFLVTIAAIFFICLVTNSVFSHDNTAISDRISENSMNLKYNESIFTNHTLRNFSVNRANNNNNNNSSLNMQRDLKIPEVSLSTLVPMIEKKNARKICTSYFYDTEIFLNMFLLLLLVWFLNREFEIRYRLSFYGNAVAARDKSRVQAMKNQADWLLHNIIPKYVADQLKTTAKYSQNHKSVGIIFASIVNFNELYDESYLGGKEYLRVLNELIGDFDELLEKPEFSHVEKIKTIGSTFMAASGLNPHVREQSHHEYWHLFQLIDFAVAMQKVIDDFNRDLLGFKLILRVGFNYGDVTAGVIGATKLYYDIWGDAVNIASRMDSTGVPGRIQLASNSFAVLSENYHFEARGQVYVKGKDHMDVFLMIGKKENVSSLV